MSAVNQPRTPRVTVVGVGASAGGVGALVTLLEQMPSDTGAAFVVIVHLDPQGRSELSTILAARTDMPVVTVTGKLSLEKNRVYVIPPDRQLEISDSEIAARPFDEPRGRRMPIDSFFRSLAGQHGDGLALILTGGGSDGAVGIKAVKESGGLILVQDPAEAEFSSMPAAAIATGVVDFVLPLKQLAERLTELIRIKDQVVLVQTTVDDDENLRRILAHLRVRTGHDFSHYKRSTVMRRLMRRMQVTRKDAFEDYFAHLRNHGEEAQALLADLLISVTTFFRDPKAFKSLADNVLPQLFRKADRSPLRVWVAGCATGEEAYSLAILLVEEAGRHELGPEIQIFGSDMDSHALNIAREGRYPTAIDADVSEDRLRRFFTRDGDDYRVKRELRDMVLFANHSLLKDPPFSRLDLASCRNLLIYLERDLQHQVLNTLHYGLNSDGFLFLGSSETGEHPERLFRVVERDARIYQSTGRAGNRLPALPRMLGVVGDPLAVAASPPLDARGAAMAHRQALEKYAPPSILVDQAGRAMHLSEQAGRYLQPSAGPMTTDIADLVRAELRFELRSALRRAFERGEGSLSPAVPVRFNGSAHPVYLQVRPQRGQPDDKEAKRAVIFFIEGETDLSDEAHAAGSGQKDDTVSQLRLELDAAQARLRTMREESESAHEELSAANEELQSINEEYRSTAEELETSKEELQSINEELQTVNSELKAKLETVSRASSEQTMMAAMDFGTVFLDNSLHIKRFTPRVTEIFSITPADIGRPITDFTHQLNYDGLANDARSVLNDLAPIDREIRSHKGGHYLARLRPYRTADDKIDGVVATFIDVTERHQMQDDLRKANEKLEKRSSGNGEPTSKPGKGSTARGK